MITTNVAPRVIKFKLLTQNSLEEITTSARLLGELRKEIKDAGLTEKFGVTNLNDVHFIERDTRAVLATDDTVLPAHECILFVSIMKSKAGAVLVPMCYDDIDLVEEMSYDELIQLGRFLNVTEDANINISLNPEDLCPDIENYLEDKFGDDDEEDAEDVSEIARTLNAIATEIDELAVRVRNIPVGTASNDAIKVTAEELQQEAQQIARNLRNAGLGR